VIIIKVTNLPPIADEESLYRLFSRCGAVLGVRIFAKHITEKFAVIHFAEEAALEKAQRLDGLRIDGCHICVEVRQRMR
jgi:RNA recognition motif-containing protein